VVEKACGGVSVVKAKQNSVYLVMPDAVIITGRPILGWYGIVI
jgi:hypothetical protein